MIPDVKLINLSIRIVTYTLILKNLVQQMKIIEQSSQVPANERLLQIKKIKIELDKVGTEIDSIKKEFNLLRTLNMN